MNEKKSTYRELLRDPRWQRLRLEIMQRDEWRCTKCGDAETNLQVHHTFYLPGHKPWEYERSALVTLCENCHLKEGFKVVGEDEYAIYFRVEAGLLVDHDDNNGASVWIEHDEAKPNASVDRGVLVDDRGRRAMLREAVEALILNFRRKT